MEPFTAEESRIEAVAHEEYLGVFEARAFKIDNLLQARGEVHEGVGSGEPSSSRFPIVRLS